MNKKAQQMTLGTIIAIVLGIAVLVFLIAGFSMGWENLWDKVSGAEPEFRITVEECRNETSDSSLFIEEEVYFSGITREDSNLESFVRSGAMSNFGKMNYSLSQYTCSLYASIKNTSRICKRIPIESGGHKAMCDYVNVSGHAHCYGWGRGEEEVCEDVEVEGFVLKELIYCRSNTDEYGNLIVNIFQSDYPKLIYSNSTHDCLYDYDNIMTQDLSIEWLDENCEGIFDSFYQENCDENNEFPETYCEGYLGEYKCGDYKVEVVR